MTSEWDIFNVLNCFGDASPEYFNVYSEIGAPGDASPKIKKI